MNAESKPMNQKRQYLIILLLFLISSSMFAMIRKIQLSWETGEGVRQICATPVRASLSVSAITELHIFDISQTFREKEVSLFHL